VVALQDTVGDAIQDVGDAILIASVLVHAWTHRDRLREPV
jgi:hypothetical protein